MLFVAKEISNRTTRTRHSPSSSFERGSTEKLDGQPGSIGPEDTPPERCSFVGPMAWRHARSWAADLGSSCWLAALTGASYCLRLELKTNVCCVDLTGKCLASPSDTRSKKSLHLTAAIGGGPARHSR